MPERSELVFLLDVDNTLLDNDEFERELRRQLAESLGESEADEFFAVFEEARAELGYADYLGALQRYRIRHLYEPRLLALSLWLVDYPFAERLFPNVLAVIERLRELGRPVVLSDGDVVFQPRKIKRSGIWDAVAGDVLVYVHKEAELDDVARRYPAERYVLVDDKRRILAAVKERWGDRVTTVFVRQGHYATHPEQEASSPAPDVAVERIADLLGLDASVFRPSVSER